MKSILAIAKREIALLFTNKTTFIFAVVLPFVSILFFNTLLQQGVPRDLPIAVIDLDKSALSRNLISTLDATPEVKISFTALSQEEGEALVKTGKAYGLVTIPEKFESDLKQGRQTEVINQYNGNIILAGGLENKAFNRVIGTLSAAANIQKQMKQGLNINQAKSEYQAIISKNHILSNPYTNYSYYLNSGFLTMFFQIFVILTTIYCFGSDFKFNNNKGSKLKRIAGGNLYYLITGKIVPYTIWFFLIGLVMLYSMYVFQDFPLNGNKLAILLGLFLLIIANQSFAILFISLSKSFRGALTIGSGFAAVCLSFSGITFPIFGMPKILQLISQVFPFTHFLNLFLDQTQRNFPVYYSMYPFIALIALTILPAIFAWFKLKKLVEQDSYLQYL